VLAIVAIGYTEKIPSDQIKSEQVAVNCSKMLKNFARAVKNLHNLNFAKDFGDWAGKVGGS
jgi:aminoglycoside phosphotransferase